MSVNQHGRIVGQVVHPGVAASDRKQKQPLTLAAQNIIEISSDEDENLQPPPKRTLTKRGRLTPTHESDYKTRLSQKDREIEKLKKVRHQRCACGCSRLTLYRTEGERVGTSRYNPEEGTGGKEFPSYSCAFSP